MAINTANIIIYFPLGGGGNLIRNIITLDTQFDFNDNQEFSGSYPTTESRFEFIKKYYKQPIDSTLWLHREWSIRSRYGNKYYNNNKIGYWNPDFKVAYLIHGEIEELYGILLDQNLPCYDRYRIENGTRPEELSPWTTQECFHIFMLPKDIDYVTDIYASKNYVLNQFDQNLGYQERKETAKKYNRQLYQRLLEIKEFLLTHQQTVIDISVEEIFGATGAFSIQQLFDKLSVNVPTEMIKEIHSIWLQSTKELYYNTYNRELK